METTTYTYNSTKRRLAITRCKGLGVATYGSGDSLIEVIYWPDRENTISVNTNGGEMFLGPSEDWTLEVEASIHGEAAISAFDASSEGELFYELNLMTLAEADVWNNEAVL